MKTSLVAKLPLKKLKTETKIKKKLKKLKIRSKLIFLKNIIFFIADQNCHSDCTYNRMERSTCSKLL